MELENYFVTESLTFDSGDEQLIVLGHLVHLVDGSLAVACRDHRLDSM